MNKNHELFLRPLKDRPGKKRITIDIPMPIFEGVAKAVQLRYCTLTKWVNRAIIEKLQEEEKYWKQGK